MAKQSGLGYAVTVDDSGGTPRVISNDSTDFDFATPRDAQDVTGVDKFAHERLLLLADFSCTVNGVMNLGAVPSATSHGVFATVSSTSVPRTTALAISGKSLTNEVIFTDYKVSRGSDGKFTYSCPGVLADGTIPTWA